MGGAEDLGGERAGDRSAAERGDGEVRRQREQLERDCARGAELERSERVERVRAEEARHVGEQLEGDACAAAESGGEEDRRRRAVAAAGASDPLARVMGAETLADAFANAAGLRPPRRPRGGRSAAI